MRVHATNSNRALQDGAADFAGVSYQRTASRARTNAGAHSGGVGSRRFRRAYSPGSRREPNSDLAHAFGLPGAGLGLCLGGCTASWRPAALPDRRRGATGGLSLQSTTAGAATVAPP